MNTQPHTLLVGASKGIGYALARDLLAGGHRLTLGGRSSENLQAAVTQLRAERPDAQLATLTVDLSRHAAARLP